MRGVPGVISSHLFSRNHLPGQRAEAHVFVFIPGRKGLKTSVYKGSRASYRQGAKGGTG